MTLSKHHLVIAAVASACALPALAHASPVAKTAQTKNCGDLRTTNAFALSISNGPAFTGSAAALPGRFSCYNAARVAQKFSAFASCRGLEATGRFCRVNGIRGSRFRCMSDHSLGHTDVICRGSGLIVRFRKRNIQ